MGGDTPKGPASRRGRLVRPPREVTPGFPAAADLGGVSESLAAITAANGAILLATTDSTLPVAHLWDLETGNHLREFDHPASSAETVWLTGVDLTQAPDGRLLLATGGDTNLAWVWDPETGDCVCTLAGHDGPVTSVAWAPDGRLLLATGSDDGSARVWNPVTGECVRILADADYSSVQSVAWGRIADGRSLLATARHDQTARIWNPETGDCLCALSGHGDAVQSVAWGHAADGRPLLATASDDGTARIWNPETGDLRSILTGHDGPVTSVAWGRAADGRPLLATASADGTARIWDPGTRAEIASVPAQTYRRSIDWALDRAGNLLLLTCNDVPGPVRAWLVEAPAPS